MKIARKSYALMALPLLVIAFTFCVGHVHSSLIQRENNAQIKPTLYPNGSIMVSRQRQADGSIREFLHWPNGSQKVLDIRPADTINKPQGLFQTRYLVYGGVLCYGIFVAIALSLPVLVVSIWLRRRRNQA